MKQLRYKGMYRSKPNTVGLKAIAISGVLSLSLYHGANFVRWLYTPYDLINPLGVQLAQAQAPTQSPQATTTPSVDNSPKAKILAAWGPVEGPRALRVAFCESSLNPGAAHTVSSAKGLFQIIRGTWDGYKCAGSPLNADDNIACAYAIYQANGWNHTSSWAASYPCHGVN